MNKRCQYLNGKGAKLMQSDKNQWVFYEQNILMKTCVTL